MPNTQRIKALLLSLSLALTAPTSQALTIEAGSFTDLMWDQRNLAFQKFSNDYVFPQANDLTDMRLLADALVGQNGVIDINLLQTRADAVDYEVVQFTDNFSNSVYLGVREELVNGDFTRGWGTYWVNLTPAADAIVSAPHPLFDTNTPRISAEAFRQADARFYMQAGAHRSANGTNTADMADPGPTVFNEFNEAFTDSTADRHWQVHGFAMSNYTEEELGDDAFPIGSDSVNSAGTGDLSPEIILLDQLLEAQNFESYAFNTLPVNDPDNLLVNGNIPGTRFSPLGATQNGQRQYSTLLGESFIHIELEFNIRNNANLRLLAAETIASAIVQSETIPEPTTAIITLPLALIYLTHRRHHN